MTKTQREILKELKKFWEENPVFDFEGLLIEAGILEELETDWGITYDIGMTDEEILTRIKRANEVLQPKQ